MKPHVWTLIVLYIILILRTVVNLQAPKPAMSPRGTVKTYNLKNDDNYRGNAQLYKQDRGNTAIAVVKHHPLRQLRKRARVVLSGAYPLRKA